MAGTNRLSLLWRPHQSPANGCSKLGYSGPAKSQGHMMTEVTWVNCMLPCIQLVIGSSLTTRNKNIARHFCWGNRIWKVTFLNHHVGIENLVWVNILSGYGLWPDGTKPLLEQCWLISNQLLWYSHVCNLSGNIKDINNQNVLQI